MLGVETPKVPGDVSLAGTLSSCSVAELAKRYKAWLYLNPKGLSSHFTSGPRISNRAVGLPSDQIQRAGCRLVILDFFRPPVPAEQTQQLLQAMSQLPRPLMVQCSTGTRSSALLILWLAKVSGHNLEATLRVAEDMKCLRRLMDSGWVHEWLQPELNSPLEVVQPSGYLLEAFFEAATSSLSYLVVCKTTKEAVLIDPSLNRTEAYLELLDEAGINLKYVINTHCHYDHVSATGSDALRARSSGLRLLSSKESGAAADEFLCHGQLVHFGNYRLEVRATPGHTAGCLTYVLQGPDDPKVTFTGDTLLVRGCGRTDFASGDAGQLYDSIHQQIFTLDPTTQIYPAHEYNGSNNSTVGEEKAYNPRLTHSKEDFILLMDELELPQPRFQEAAEGGLRKPNVIQL